MPEQDAYLLQVLIGQESDYREINSVLGKALGVLPESELLQQSATCPGLSASSARIGQTTRYIPSAVDAPARWQTAEHLSRASRYHPHGGRPCVRPLERRSGMTAPAFAIPFARTLGENASMDDCAALALSRSCAISILARNPSAHPVPSSQSPSARLRNNDDSYGTRHAAVAATCRQ
jgi:hypothetical protein